MIACRSHSLAAVVAAAVCLLGAPLGAQKTGPYDLVTNNYHDVHNFNVETVRGMDFAVDGNLYAINSHGSMLLRHVDATPQPEGAWPTVANPISMDVFGDVVLVVGGASHVLVIHDRFSGAVLSLLDLPNEPGGIAVDDAASIAYVVSQGENLVVAIDISDPTAPFEIERQSVPGERPCFIELDVDPATQVTQLLIAPTMSGNNTVPAPGSTDPSASRELATGEIVFLPSISSTGGLPDEDIIVLPTVGGTLTGASGKGAGTIMTDLGRNPLTGEVWALTVDLQNDIMGQRGEHELKGIFAHNNLAIFTADGLSAPMSPPDRIIDLDDANPLGGKQYGADTSVSTPYGLAFVPAANDILFGWGVITSSTNDRFVVCAPNGTRIVTWDLPEGSIPRDVLIDPLFGFYLAIYCWGSNTIRVHNINDLNAEPIVLQLGVDPTPPRIQNGRRTWYDADLSRDGRSTCNSCHSQGGKTDMLAWKLSDLEDDQKDIMVTQDLQGIYDLQPLHWRGERRDLRDFNGAFKNLLGHADLLDASPGGTLDDFVEFVFSLQPDASPHQSPARELDDNETSDPFRNGLIGSAVDGQVHFTTVLTVPPFTCESCHMLPGSTQNAAQADGFSRFPRGANVDVAHFRQILQKDQDLIVTDLNGTPRAFPRGGYGFLHPGNILDLFAFVEAFGTLSPQQHSDVTAFALQFDQGVTPAVHEAFHLDDRGTRVTEQAIRDLFFPQVDADWLDLVAFGTALIGGEPVVLRWYYDAPAAGGEGVFVPHLPILPSMPLGELADLAEGGEANLVFLALPWGGGETWALDPDNDGLSEFAELAAGTNPQHHDTDGDGFPDGYEIAHRADPLVPNEVVADGDPPVVAPDFPRLDHVTAGTTKFFVETDELVTVVATAQVLGGPSYVETIYTPARRHTVVISNLDPSTEGGLQNTYTITVDLTDLSGNTTTAELSSMQRDLARTPGGLHVNELQWLVTTPNEIGLTAAADILVEVEDDSPFPMAAAGQIVVFYVLFRTDPDEPWAIANEVMSSFRADSFQVRTQTGDVPYNNFPGPYLLSDPLVSGRTAVDFTFPNVPRQGEHAIGVRLSVQGILTPVAGYDPEDPIFEFASISDWRMPATDGDKRGIETEY